MTILLDISIALFILFVIYTWCWYLLRTERENQTPIFHKEYNKEIIYRPRKKYFDKLQYRDHDLNKLIRESRQEREQSLMEIYESSPIPRHPKSPAQSNAFVPAEDLKKHRKI